MSTPVARSLHSTAMTSERARRNGRAPPSPHRPASRSGQCRRASTTGCPAARRSGPEPGPTATSAAADNTRRTTSAPTSGVSTVCSTAKSAASSAEMPGPQRRAEPLGPVFGDHCPRRPWHVDDRGTQHHHHFVAAAAVQGGDRGTQPATLAGKHLRHAVAGSGAGGQHHPGAANGLRHANSLNLSDSETRSATPGALGLEGFNRLGDRQRM